MMKNNIYIEKIGRRKTAVARVRLTPGTGKTTDVAGKFIFSDTALAPLNLIGKRDNFDISVSLSGGGFNSQQDAVALGIARALCEVNIELRPALKKAGFLTRDQREKERKKPGLKRARKAPQWAKR